MNGHPHRAFRALGMIVGILFPSFGNFFHPIDALSGAVQSVIGAVRVHWRSLRIGERSFHTSARVMRSPYRLLRT